MADGTRFDGLFRAIDAMDSEAFVGFLTDDAEFCYGSQPPVRGRAAIRDYVAGFFTALEALEHRIVEVHDAGDGVSVIEGEVTYHPGPGRTVTLPFANVFRLRDGRVSSYRVYIDPTPMAE